MTVILLKYVITVLKCTPKGHDLRCIRGIVSLCTLGQQTGETLRGCAIYRTYGRQAKAPTCCTRRCTSPPRKASHPSLTMVLPRSCAGAVVGSKREQSESIHRKNCWVCNLTAISLSGRPRFLLMAQQLDQHLSTYTTVVLSTLHPVPSRRQGSTPGRARNSAAPGTRFWHGWKSGISIPCQNTHSGVCGTST